MIILPAPSDRAARRLSGSWTETLHKSVICVALCRTARLNHFIKDSNDKRLALILNLHDDLGIGWRLVRWQPR